MKTVKEQREKKMKAAMIAFRLQVAMCKAVQKEIENLVKEGEISPEEGIEKEIDSLSLFPDEVVCRVYNVDYASEAVPYISDNYHREYLD